MASNLNAYGFSPNGAVNTVDPAKQYQQQHAEQPQATTPTPATPTPSTSALTAEEQYRKNYGFAPTVPVFAADPTKVYEEHKHAKEVQAEKEKAKLVETSWGVKK